MRAWWISFLFGECEFPSDSAATRSWIERPGSLDRVRVCARVRAFVHLWEKPETPEARDTGRREREKRGPSSTPVFLGKESRLVSTIAIHYTRFNVVNSRKNYSLLPRNNLMEGERMDIWVKLDFRIREFRKRFGMLVYFARGLKLWLDLMQGL